MIVCNASSMSKAQLWKGSSWSTGSLWKPLRGPLTDWPLALCDAQTVDKQRDFIASDVVTRTGFTENFQCYYNPDYRWYYLNNQLASEIIIFRQTDTEESFAIGERSFTKGSSWVRFTDSFGKAYHTLASTTRKLGLMRNRGRALKLGRLCITDAIIPINDIFTIWPLYLRLYALI